MPPSNRSLDDVVLAAWAPAGWGQIVVLLGQGVVIHKVAASGKALAAGTGQIATAGKSGGERDASTLEPVSADELRRSPFISKVLRDGVTGLLASPRKTLLRWDEITSAAYRKLALYRGRLVIRTSSDEYKLKFLQNTVVVGDPVAVFTHYLGGRFTATS